jgi:hypothetical protein
LRRRAARGLLECVDRGLAPLDRVEREAEVFQGSAGALSIAMARRIRSTARDGSPDCSSTTPE